ncbi:9584_t:CDS:2 [Dentiscutata erythropus]|uniref:9584_t:CDS:1 n=1 Tax=Dentiscutata erythropus TaxID=1348616 RepID=A0A9N8ZVR7_9GLOM|nr:9584_t:CDS:2 [Dentiscutata erythropus]
MKPKKESTAQYQRNENSPNLPPGTNNMKSKTPAITKTVLTNNTTEINEITLTKTNKQNSSNETTKNDKSSYSTNSDTCSRNDDENSKSGVTSNGDNIMAIPGTTTPTRLATHKSKKKAQ